MNLTFQEGEKLLDDILKAEIALSPHQKVIFAVPFPYLIMTRSEVEDEPNYYAAATKLLSQQSRAFTGEFRCRIILHFESTAVLSHRRVLLARSYMKDRVT